MNHDTIDEQRIYDHLLELVKSQPPETVLDRFKSLFIRARGYDAQEVLKALTVVISSKEAEGKFPFILHRCCYILINRWQMQPQLHQYVLELVEAFEILPQSLDRKYLKSFSSRLHQLVINFVKSENYKQLKRLATVICEGKKNNPDKQKELLGNLITRYPYLYEHSLLNAESTIDQQQTVYKIKRQLEKNFEVKLSKYITYQIRLAQIRRDPKLAQKSAKIIPPVPNPTLLSERDLGKSLKHYVGTVENGYTYKDLSRSFITHTNDVRNYQIFKDELYEYIIQSIDPQYGKHRFNEKLYKKLQGMYPKFNQQPPNELLKIRTYNQVFNYLLVESPQNPQHLVFMDLITNIGTTRTIGLFLKLVLVCSKVKPYLEKRFSILFNHYESFNRDGTVWLVRSLEKQNVAFSVNFGNLDLSFLREIYTKKS